jgi:hypothetical protein
MSNRVIHLLNCLERGRCGEEARESDWVAGLPASPHPHFPVYDSFRQVTCDFIYPDTSQSPQIRAATSIVARVSAHVASFRRRGMGLRHAAHDCVVSSNSAERHHLPKVLRDYAFSYTYRSSSPTTELEQDTFRSEIAKPNSLTPFVASRLSLPSAGGTVPMLEALPSDMADYYKDIDNILLPELLRKPAFGRPHVANAAPGE